MEVAWLLLVLVASSFASPIGQTISWQAHSYNDLDEWPQLLAKGARYIKIDPHFMPASFCANQTQLEDPNDPRGCFVLNHDTPGGRNDYNSSWNLLQMLADPFFKSWFSLPQRLFIALCFKDAPEPCSGKQPGNDWLSMVDDFFNEANSRVASAKLNLEFVLDGDGCPSGCYMQRWRPWNATSGPDEAFYSNNPTLGYDRWQVMNPVFVELPAYAALDYGKFINSTYSYQVWEPSDEAEIESVANVYISKGLVHEPGFRYAINIDPAMFEVYSAESTGKPYTWHSAIQSEGARPKVTLIQTANSSASGSQILLLTFRKPSDPTSHFYNLGTLTSNGFATRTGEQILPQSSNLETIESVSSISIESLAFVQMVDSVGLANLYQLSTANGSMESVGYYKTVPSGVSSVRYSTSVLLGTSSCKSSKGTCIIIAQVFAASSNTQSRSCDSAIQLWELPVDQIATAARSLVPAEVGPSFCLQTGILIESASIALTFSNASDSVKGLVFFSAVHAIYAVSVDFKLPFQAFAISQPVKISAGDHPASALLTTEDGDDIIMLVHANGFCQNNEVQNKRPVPASCRQTPISTPHVLVYSYATLSQWNDLLENKEMLNACSRKVFHGSYDQGAFPSIALFQLDDTSNRVGMAEVHEGFRWNWADVGNCGRPNNHTDQLLLDGWPLPDPTLLR